MLCPNNFITTFFLFHLVSRSVWFLTYKFFIIILRIPKKSHWMNIKKIRVTISKSWEQWMSQANQIYWCCFFHWKWKYLCFLALRIAKVSHRKIHGTLRWKNRYTSHSTFLRMSIYWNINMKNCSAVLSLCNLQETVGWIERILSNTQISSTHWKLTMDRYVCKPLPREIWVRD